jgi:CHAD domain-containing protein
MAQGVRALRRTAKTARVVAQDRARAALESNRYARFMRRLETWLAGEGWRAAREAETKDGSDASARTFAERALNKRLVKLLARGKRIDQLPIDDLHAMRIAVKKARYGIDALSAVLNKRRAGKLAATLKTLQDDLGHLNDLAMAEEMIPRLAEAVPAEERATILRGGGEVVAHYRRIAEQSFPSLNRRWRAFRKVDLL